MRRRCFECCSGLEKLPQFDHGPFPLLEEQRKEVAEARRRFDERLSNELG